MNSKEVSLKTLKAVRDLGRRGGVFQTQQVRAHLNYSDESPEAHKMHNVIARLKTAKTVVQAGSNTRKRNQYLEIANQDDLHKRIERAEARMNGSRNRPPVVAGPTSRGSQKTSTPAVQIPGTSGPRRVVYLEDRVDRLEATVKDLAGLPDALRAIQERLDGVDQSVRDLVALWS